MFSSSRLPVTKVARAFDVRDKEPPSKRSKVQSPASSDDEETQLEDEDEESGQLFTRSDTLSDEAAPIDLTSWPFFFFSSFLFLFLLFLFLFFISFRFFSPFCFLLFSSVHQPGLESAGCQKRRGVCKALEDLDEAAGISPRSNQVGEAKSWKTAEVEDDQKPLSHLS